MLRLDVVLIAFRRKAQSAIKKSVEKAQPFHLAVNFNGAPLEALSLQEFSREMCLGYGNRPAELGKRDSLGSATSPISQDNPSRCRPPTWRATSLLKCRKISSIRGERGGSEFRDQLDRKIVGMTLNHPNQAQRDHASLLT